MTIASKGQQCFAKSVILQTHPCLDPDKPDDHIRLGITVSKKIGKAVIRNRARRQLKAIGRHLLTNKAKPNIDYVIVARKAILTRKYIDIIKDISYCLHQTGTHS